MAWHGVKSTLPKGINEMENFFHILQTSELEKVTERKRKEKKREKTK